MRPPMHALGIDDQDGDGIVDTVRARLYIPDNPTAEEVAGAANLAARLAFESLSIDLPMGFVESEFESGDAVPIFVGRTASRPDAKGVCLPDVSDCNRLAQSLGVEEYKPGDPYPSEIHRRRNLSNALQTTRKVIIGSHERSTSIIDLAARIALESVELHLPLVTVAAAGSHVPKGSILVGSSIPHVQRLIDSGRLSIPEAGGRIALLDENIVVVGATAADEGLALQHLALRMPYLWTYGKGQVSVATIESEVASYRSTPRPQPDVVFDERFSMAWEVDEARRHAEKLLPLIRRGSVVRMDARLSEPREIRRQLEHELFEMFTKAGASDASSVRVLCAHKQGFCWIEEHVMPRLQTASHIVIRFRELECASQSVDVADRWLHELYPIDEVLSRELGIPAGCITFEKLPASAPHVYEIVAKTADGDEIVQATFDPCSAMRPLFDVFPEYSSATVSTGWLRASVDGITAIDERIKTDYEQLWDTYQTAVLPRLRDYVLRLHQGRPDPDACPHFEELLVEAEVSEPDASLGIDQERISTLESLHEDIYFETLLFFDVLGESACGKPLKFPGRIIPRIHPSRPGAPSMRVRFTGYETPFSPTTVFEGAIPEVTTLDVDQHGATAVEVHASGTRFCRQLTKRDAKRLPETEEADGSAVPWDEPIGPDECERIISRLARSARVRPFVAGESWMGRTIWAMDIVNAGTGSYFSTAKAIAARPCLFITGRQHANEVSSTSHILKFVEFLIRDPEGMKLLDHVNFIMQPITNPDGAALVEELHRLTPDFMLHAGYLGALGVDVTHDQWSQSPQYPEARVRAELWSMWQPDIVLNPHGYPSHEWVQLFAGYTAWVRSKNVKARDWWIPRGWFMPAFDFIDDARFPSHRKAAMELSDRIAAVIDEAFGEINARMYRRYEKYTGNKLEMHGNVLIQSTGCGSRPDPHSFGFMTRHPDVTFFEGLSEAPDEVASGDWLRSLCHAGLQFSLVHARYLADLPKAVLKTRWEDRHETIFAIRRQRLPL